MANEGPNAGPSSSGPSESGAAASVDSVYTAITNGDIGAVEAYLSRDPRPNVNAQDDQGFTLLGRSAFYNQLAIAKLLRRHHANPNLHTNNGWSPLMITCERSRGYAEFARWLILQCRVKLDLTNSGGCSALFLATTNNHEEIVDLILNKTARTDIPTADGWTPLLTCAEREKGFTRLARKLLHKGSDVNHQNEERVTALYLCAVNGFAELSRLLLDEGRADPNLAERAGWTPLHAAIEKNQLDVYTVLVESPLIDLDRQNQLGFTPVYLSARFNRVDLLRDLLRRGASVDKCSETGWSPLLGSVQKAMGFQECVEALLDNGADVNHRNANGVSALYLACFNAFSDIARLLLAKGALVNIVDDKNWSALHTTVQESTGHVETAKVLVAAGINVNLTTEAGSTALYLSTLHSFLEISTLLCEEGGADPNIASADGWSPLLGLCSKDSSAGSRAALVRLLLKNGADVNQCKQDGVSPLYLAGLNGYVDIAELLLAHEDGADPNASDKSQWSPMMVLGTKAGDAAPASEAIARLLLRTGKCLLDLRNKEGLTALYLCCCHSNVAVMKLLLAHGCDTDLSNNFGWTPLMLAAWEEREEVVALLLEAKADPNVQMKNHLSALFWACMKGNVPIARRLIAAGGLCDFESREDIAHTCLQGHDLVDFVADVDKLFCTICGTSYSKGAVFRQCKPCNFGTCTKCVDGQRSSGSISALEYAETNGHDLLARHIAFATESPVAGVLRELGLLEHVWALFDAGLLALGDCRGAAASAAVLAKTGIANQVHCRAIAEALQSAMCKKDADEKRERAMASGTSAARPRPASEQQPGGIAEVGSGGDGAVASPDLAEKPIGIARRVSTRLSLILRKPRQTQTPPATPPS